MTNNPTGISIKDLLHMKQQNQKIACLTAYDASFSQLLDEQGIDVILVGDSLGMVIQGKNTTLPVTLDDMVYHSRCVISGSKNACVVCDLPFMSYATPQQAATSSARIMQKGGAHMVKLEGGRNRAETIHHLVGQGIPVCGHLGLTPQSIHQIGGFHFQGKDENSANTILDDAKILQQAGVSLLVLECIPSDLATKISHSLTIPTIGIGAGSGCDGQVLVLYDMLGISPGKRPKFSHNFLAENGDINAAVKKYIEAVRSGDFPNSNHIHN